MKALDFLDFACFIFMFSLLFPARPHGVLAFGSSMSDHQSFDVFLFVFSWYPSLNSYQLPIVLQASFSLMSEWLMGTELILTMVGTPDFNLLLPV